MINSCATAIFKRGSSFKFSLKLPESVPDGKFAGWTPTAQLRKHRDDRADSLIATVAVAWEDITTTRTLVINHPDTSDWPLGLADFDILLTAADGTKLHSATMFFDIQRSVTK